MEFTARVAGIVEIERWRKVSRRCIVLIRIRTRAHKRRERFRECLDHFDRRRLPCRLTVRISQHLTIRSNRQQCIARINATPIKLERSNVLNAERTSSRSIERADGIVIVGGIRCNKLNKLAIERISDAIGIIRFRWFRTYQQRQLVNRSRIRLRYPHGNVGRGEVCATCEPLAIRSRHNGLCRELHA